MKQHKTIKPLFVLLLICFSCTVCSAQIQRNDWIGTYAITHDGWEGKLIIKDTKKDCSNSPWCSMDILYIDSKGNKRKAVISSFSKDWQNINFRIHFPQHVQQFKGYMFSHDKNVLAGITVWNNQNFGFYAKKQLEQALPQVKLYDLNALGSEIKIKAVEETGQAQDEVVKRRVLGDGSVELTYKSGKTETYTDHSKTIKQPDGTTITQMYVQVPTLAPPMPNEPEINTWLGIMNSNMDDIVSHLLNGDSTSIKNYKKILSKYKDVERINNSIKTIEFLIE